MMLVELFGKDKGGKYKVWAIGTTESGDLTIAHGQEGGKMTVKMEKIKPKNVGRANETTPEQQADIEANGRIKKQIDKGYRLTKEELDSLPVLPMLAGDYNKIGHRINYKKGVYLSDKLDGVRMMAKCLKDGTITLESRTGQPYDLPHIVQELTNIMQPGDILDGEAYLHGYVLQDITSAVKRTDTQKKVDSARKRYEKAVGDESIAEAYAELQEAILIQELRPKLQFVIFAVIESETVSQDMPFSEVVIETYGYRNYRAMDNEFIKFIHYELAYSEEEMKVAHKDAVRRGYEGIMIRNADGVNESGKRSADLQKYKEFLDSEFEILDILPAKDDGSVFLVRNDLNSLTFTVTLGSMSERAEYLANKNLYIGKLITVKYQTRYKDTLLPQFPTGVAIRDYE
jgi:DNA ligase-1